MNSKGQTNRLLFSLSRTYDSMPFAESHQKSTTLGDESERSSSNKPGEIEEIDHPFFSFPYRPDGFELLSQSFWLFVSLNALDAVLPAGSAG
jgi:hypothetical protein